MLHTTLCSDTHLATDPLRLLKRVDAEGLAGYLKTERSEFGSLPGQPGQYEHALSELKLHLNHVFSSVGGIGALPLSATTKELLDLPMVKMQDNVADPSSVTTMMAPRTNPPLTPSSDKGAQAELDRLQDAVHELQETVAEQKADIKDLEASLRERKAEVRTLRKQLRDKELRQYAVASDYVGLRRTDSIMVETSNFLAQLRAGGECPQRQGPSLPLAKERKITDTEPWTKRRSAVHSIGKSNRKSRVAIDESSGETSTSFTPKRTSTISAKSKVQRRPEKYVNGWSVYEESSSENDKDVEHDKANASARTDADGASQDCHSAVKDSAVNKHDSCISSKMLVSADGSTADRLAKCFEALEAAGDQNAPTLALAATKSTAAPSCIRKTAAAGASRLSVVASIQPVLSLPLPHSEDMHVPSPQRTPVRKNSLSSETKSISHASCRPATSSSAVTDTDAAAPSNSSINSSTTPHILRSVVSKTPRRIYSRLSSRLKKA